jgi:membrane-associated phospholipid phosphatase
VGALWIVKMFATTLGIGAFLIAYFWILRHPFFTVTRMPLTALDRAIGFRPETLPIYLSLWVYISLGPALLRSGRELASYGAAALALSLTGLGIFILWPTAVPAFEIDWTLHPSMSFLKNLDLAGNACPSMHVAFSVFTAIWLERLLSEMGTALGIRVFNWLWCAGILYSTVATLQHVVLDVLGGIVLGSLVAMLHLRTFARRSGLAWQAELAGDRR